MCQVSISSNNLYIPPSFRMFHILLVFGLQQLKMSEICKLFQTIKLQMIFILTIINNKSTTRDVFRYNVSLFMIAPDQTSIKLLNYFQIYCISQLFILKCETSKYPTNLPRAFHVETTWKRPTDIRKILKSVHSDLAFTFYVLSEYVITILCQTQFSQLQKMLLVLHKISFLENEAA